MKITVFDKPLVVGNTTDKITIKKADFINLQPIMDMCRENKFTLIIDFSEE